MTVKVYDAQTERTKIFKGDPRQVENQLDAGYPFLGKYKPQHLYEKLQILGRQQNYFIEVEE